MKRNSLFVVTFLLSQIGISSIANAFDVQGSITFNSNETLVSTLTVSVASQGEDIDFMSAVAILKLVLASSETLIQTKPSVCYVPAGSGDPFWICPAAIFTLPASAGCKYCNRGNGKGFDLPTGNLVGSKTLSNTCKINTNPGGGGGGGWQDP